MSIEVARAYLKDKGCDDRIIEFEVSTATVALAAAAAGVEPARICKTLSFKLKDGSGVLIQVAGDARVDNKKYKDFFGEKAKMLSPVSQSRLERHVKLHTKTRLCIVHIADWLPMSTRKLDKASRD